MRAATVALNEGRLQPTHPSFRTARRAAREARDNQLLARLLEVEGSWTGAARAWRAAGDHHRAADNFRRAGEFDEAARAEEAAGRPREALLLRVRQLHKLQDRLEELRTQLGAHAPDVGVLERQIERETEALMPPLRNIESTVGSLHEHTGEPQFLLRVNDNTFFMNETLVKLDQGSFQNAEFLQIICDDLDIGEFEFNEVCTEKTSGR